MEPATRTGGAAFACALCACVGTAILAPALGAQPPRARPRAAVISDPADKLGGLADLLFAAFSEGGRVDLVERAELKKALAEQELQLVFGAAGGRSRRRLGAVLRAGYLVLLRATGSGATRGVELVVAETRHGYRLDRHAWPWDPARAAAIATGASARVRAVLDRFPGGVTLAVAIPDFLSRNLTHRFDHLQSACARVAELEALRRPGCVTVELEEARAIAQELARSEGEDRVARPHPLYLLGEFRHENAGRDAPASVSVRLKKKDGVLTEASAAHVGPGQVAPFVRRTTQRLLSVVLKRDAGDLPAPNVADEVRTLESRARAFRAAAEFEKAIALYEAALLLDPRHHPSREAILELCHRILSGGVPQGVSRAWRVEECKRRLRYARRGFEHLSTLVRTKRFESFGDLKARVEDLWRPLNRMLGSLRYNYRFERGAEAELAEVVQAHREFVLNDFPATWREGGWADLEGRKSPLTYLGWYWCMLARPLDHPYPKHPPTRADLEFRLRLARDVLSGKPRAADSLLFLVQFKSSWLESLKRRDKAVAERFAREFLRFLDQLAATERSDLVAAAAWGQLLWKRQTRPGELTEADFDAARTAAERCDDPKGRGFFLHRIAYTKYWLEHTAPPTRRPVWDPTPKPGPTDPVRYEPVTLEYLDGDRTRPVSGAQGLVRCSEGLDVLWGAREVYIVTRRGRAERIVAGSDIWITDACWDGARVWAATKQGRLLTIDPLRKTVQTIGSEAGVPPSGLDMRLCPLARGKVFAVGSFPPHARAWCALVTADGKVDVFHEARDPRASKDDIGPSIAFQPRWLVPLPAESDPARVDKILVARHAPYHPYPSLCHPLIVDPVERTVNTMRFRFPSTIYYSKIRPNAFAPRGQILLCASRWSCSLLAVDLSKGTIKRLFQLNRSPDQTGELLEWRGKLYQPGGKDGWLEITPDTLDVKVLKPVEAPWPAWDMRHFRSWHYGILAWRRSRFYRVSLTPR